MTPQHGKRVSSYDAAMPCPGMVPRALENRVSGYAMPGTDICVGCYRAWYCGLWRWRVAGEEMRRRTRRSMASVRRSAPPGSTLHAQSPRQFDFR
eukprot:194544-Rhodomonas_salina.1